MVNYGDWREALGVVFVATWTWKGVEIQRGGGDEEAGGEIRKGDSEGKGRLRKEETRKGGSWNRGRLGKGEDSEGENQKAGDSEGEGLGSGKTH